MINGRIIIASVNAPDSMEYPQCSVVAKNSSPNRPYTIEGMPERVSAVIRMIPTILPVLDVYKRQGCGCRFILSNSGNGKAG